MKILGKKLELEPSDETIRDYDPDNIGAELRKIAEIERNRRTKVSELITEAERETERIYLNRIRKEEQKARLEERSRLFLEKKSTIYFMKELLTAVFTPVYFLIKLKTISKDSNDASRSTAFCMLMSMRFLFPKKYREEWIGDLIETVNILKAEGHPKWWIRLLVFSQVIIVIYHATVFKLGEYFSTGSAKISEKQRT